MASDKDPLTHLISGIEELCLAAAGGLARLREGLDSPATDGIWRIVLEWLETAEGRARVRKAVEVERERWADLAGTDPAAARVRDLCDALLDLLDEPGRSERGENATRRRPARPRRA